MIVRQTNTESDLKRIVGSCQKSRCRQQQLYKTIKHYCKKDLSIHFTRSTKTVDNPKGESYLFVMENNNELVGICGIISKVGGFEPFYTYVTRHRSPRKQRT